MNSIIKISCPMCDSENIILEHSNSYFCLDCGIHFSYDNPQLDSLSDSSINKPNEPNFFNAASNLDYDCHFIDSDNLDLISTKDLNTLNLDFLDIDLLENMHFGDWDLIDDSNSIDWNEIECSNSNNDSYYDVSSNSRSCNKNTNK